MLKSSFWHANPADHLDILFTTEYIRFSECYNSTWTLLEGLHRVLSFKHYSFPIFLYQIHSSFEFIKTCTQTVTAYYNEEFIEFLKGWACFYFYLSLPENRNIKKYIQKFCF